MATYSNATNPFIEISEKKTGVIRADQEECQAKMIKEEEDEGSSDVSKNNSKDNNEQIERDCIKEACQNLVELVAESPSSTKDNSEEPKEHPQTNTKLAPHFEIKNDTNLDKRNGDKKYNEEEENEDKAVEIEESSGGKEKTPMEQDGRQYQHIELIRKLRLQLRDLEKYAYERGEFSERELPDSVLAERQKVIIEALNKKLSLNLDKEKIEKLELDKLKEQVDKEIDELIDPLITREHLLIQLKTQLTDLERYISHLHKTLGRKQSIGLTGQKVDTNNNINDDDDCICPKHGTRSLSSASEVGLLEMNPEADSIMNNDSLPRTSRLIRGLLAQLVCSDVKIRDSIKKVDSRTSLSSQSSLSSGQRDATTRVQTTSPSDTQQNQAITKTPQFHDGATWTLHLDKVILATDSLINLYTLDQNVPKVHQGNHNNNGNKPNGPIKTTNHEKQSPQSNATHSNVIDEALVESVVRRQLIPALRDLLCYGLIDPSTLPKPNSYSSFFDPYYLLSSLTCLPGLTNTTTSATASNKLSSSSSAAAQFRHPDEKIHLWDIFEDYYQSRSDVNNFKSSSVKTLSQSFQLKPSMDGPIKVTSKQALLIAIDDVIQRLIRRKPNGPESHFKMLVYMALNQCKLSTWLRIVFKNKSVVRKYYHNFSFVCQPEKMDRFLSIIDRLSSIEFKLSIDTDQSIADQFVSAF